SSEESDEAKNSARDPKTKDQDTASDNATGKDGIKTPANAKQSGFNGEPAGKEKSNKVSAGALRVLPDQDQLVPLSPRETEPHLEEVVERILREGRRERRHAQIRPENVKDW